VTPTVFCPVCKARGFRRHGVHFDHEWRCGACDLTWEPDKTYLLIEWKDLAAPVGGLDEKA